MEDIKHCPACGQVVIPKTSKLQLRPQQQQVLDAVRERPRTTQQLRSLLWGHRPDGGPSDKCLHVIVSQLNRQLRPYGIKLRNPQSEYRIVEVTDANPVGQCPEDFDARPVGRPQPASAPRLDRG